MLKVRRSTEKQRRERKERIIETLAPKLYEKKAGVMVSTCDPC